MGEAIAIRWNLNVPDAFVGDWRRWLGPGQLERLGVKIEAAGFDAVSVTDHPFPLTEWLTLISRAKRPEKLRRELDRWARTLERNRNPEGV